MELFYDIFSFHLPFKLSITSQLSWFMHLQIEIKWKIKCVELICFSLFRCTYLKIQKSGIFFRRFIYSFVVVRLKYKNATTTHFQCKLILHTAYDCWKRTHSEWMSELELSVKSFRETCTISENIYIYRNCKMAATVEEKITSTQISNTRTAKRWAHSVRARRPYGVVCCFVLRCYFEAHWVRLCLWHQHFFVRTVSKRSAIMWSLSHCDWVQQSVCYMEFSSWTWTCDLKTDSMLEYALNGANAKFWSQIKWRMEFMEGIFDHEHFWQQTNEWVVLKHGILLLLLRFLRFLIHSNYGCAWRANTKLVCHKTDSVLVCVCVCVAREIVWAEQTKRKREKKPNRVETNTNSILSDRCLHVPVLLSCTFRFKVDVSCCDNNFNMNHARHRFLMHENDEKF